ncbi:MAG: trehalose-phosphatase [Candidatus Omnitrophica bacterium]|nr:trehalose-phosphatase [Candidatus Omnitrophota bacterium]
MKYVWSHWRSLETRIRSRKTKFLIVDFDGTLAPIVKTPQAAFLNGKTRKILLEFSRLKTVKVAVISGRSLRDLMPHFRLKGIIYAGNHGLEIRGKGFQLPPGAKRARRLGTVIRLLGAKLRKNFSKVAGVWVEDKRYTVSAHYRNIHKKYLPFLNRTIALFRKKYAHWPVVWRKGKKVWELRPGIGWGKGDAALYLTGKFPRALPVVIGDDRTDEDMFRTFRKKGVTIRVGRSKRSLAEYYLRSPADVRRFLGRIRSL